jgi:uncharacterized protein YecE (DUF72 family)
MNASATWKPYDIPPDITQHGVYVGTSGYYYDDWIGLFNPPKPRRLSVLSEQEKKDQDRLQFYQKYFPFVEINSTYYHEANLEQFLDIEKRSLPRTKFTVKVHQDISHTKTWKVDEAEAAIERHITAVSPLIETGRFYSFLIQLEDHVQRAQHRLDYLLRASTVAIRKHIDVHIEFRHISWHDTHVLQSLKDNGIGICNVEIPPVKHAFPLKSYATTDKGYVRYSGRNLENWYPKNRGESPKDRLASRNARYDYLYTDAEMEERVKQQLMLTRKTVNVAVAFNNHYQTKAVQNAIQNIRMLFSRLRGEGG